MKYPVRKISSKWKRMCSKSKKVCLQVKKCEYGVRNSEQPIEKGACDAIQQLRIELLQIDKLGYNQMPVAIYRSHY